MMMSRKVVCFAIFRSDVRFNFYLHCKRRILAQGKLLLFLGITHTHCGNHLLEIEFSGNDNKSN